MLTIHSSLPGSTVCAIFDIIYTADITEPGHPFWAASLMRHALVDIGGGPETERLCVQ